ncbi:hypothetical protein ACFRKE_03360 [Kitasatospora indigofera]|uniref:hypothetical protein n=1 Tax=Kitasatospora indigofera TaxID=67307 RepID=UPI0036D06953
MVVKSYRLFWAGRVAAGVSRFAGGRRAAGPIGVFVRSAVRVSQGCPAGGGSGSATYARGSKRSARADVIERIGMNVRWVWWAAGAGVVLTAVVVALAVLVPGREPERLPVRAREYTDVRVCLLTDGQGVGGVAAAPVWAGMQDGSALTHVQVASLPVLGPATVANAQPYANTLVQQKCSTVLAGDEVGEQALRAVAAANPKVRFVVVGQGASASNLTVISPSSDVRGAVAKIVSDAGKA